MSDTVSAALLVEVLATSANLAFIVLLIREKILCWSFGIAGSLLSVYLFADARLYSEAVLYCFYGIMGIWGWLRWHRQEAQDSNPVTLRPAGFHLRALLFCSITALGLGLTVQAFTDAERPLFDAFTTVFSFLATYLEIAKVLEAWVYWFILNLASIWLYHDRSLDIYAALIGIYSIMSIWGFFSWLRSYRAQSAA